MANRIAIPSVVGLDTEGVPLNVVMFLQAVEEALKTLDNNVVYKDQVTVNPPSPLINATSAQGQAFSISGVSVASGEDFGALVGNVQTLIQSHGQLATAFKNQVDQIRGT